MDAEHPELSREECLALLATASVGRVALSVGALPVVVPVAFGLLGEHVVFRAFPTAGIAVPSTDVVLAFQADQIDPRGSGWSVLVQGLASPVVHPLEIDRCRNLDLPGLMGGTEHERFVRVESTRLTGHRIAG